MGMIANANLQAILDKLARFGALAVGDDATLSGLNAGFTAANAAVMSGAGSLFDYIFGTVTDGDVAADLLSAARDLDEENPVPPTRFLFTIPAISAFFTAMNRHIVRYSEFTTLDAYLTSLNASAPTLRVHQALHDHIKSFSRGNVFVGSDIVLATFSATGATTGTFASVSTISAYAGAQILVKNQGAVTTGATLSVTGRKLDGTTQIITATIATGTDNFETNLSSVLKLFTQVTAISITGGTNANVYEIVAKTDRDISAA